ncbi:MAG TPA: PilN domain-containing protein [Candidatus Binatia bacterium]|nr:PilN domain-containing protein [Candidatus Binatia bacterium]
MTLAELAQRIRRADFLDGLGIYVGAHEVALAHVVKRFFTVALRHARTFPLPPAARAAERRQALAQAVLTFAGENHIDTRRAYLCLPRAEAACNRILLPAAARENLGQVLEYEIEHLVPLPRDQVYFDYSARPLGEDRLEVLLTCIPREIVRVHLEALEDAFVRPRGIVLTSTAIADYLAFCRGEGHAPLGLLISGPEVVELALVTDGRLVASQLFPAARIAAPAELSRSFARQLADGFVSAEDVELYRWELGNGAGPALPPVGEGNLANLAAGRLEAPTDFFEHPEPALLPALGAALDAVREGTVPVNLLPAEGRRLSDEGLSLVTVVLVAVLGVLLLVWGGSAIVKDELIRRQVRDELAAVGPQVKQVKALEDEIAEMRRQLDILTGGENRRATVLLKELSEIVPADAYLTALNLRGGRLTMDGFARSASDLIAALEKSKHFKNVSFTSPTTKAGDKDRFSLVAEIER